MSKLDQLVIYHELAKDEFIQLVDKFVYVEKSFESQDLCFKIIRYLLEKGVSMEQYLYQLLLEADSPILSKLSSQGESSQAMTISDLNKECILNDLNILIDFIKRLKRLKKIKISGARILSQLIDYQGEHEGELGYYHFFDQVETYSIDDLLLKFIDLVRRFGTGPFAKYTSYYMDETGVLLPIEHYVNIDWDHIYQYESQKKSLLKNTRAFLEGRAFYHALLVGDSGTGKSSSVKAVVEQVGNHKLKMIQLYKSQLRSLPGLLEELSQSCFKFIIFLDDLSFEVNEDEYKLLKTSIEGGIADVAGNIAFYVTTNRRHLIKEVRTERESDIHLKDFIQEMTSLSKRFGLTLTYSSLVQENYFAMIKQMLDDHGLSYNDEEIELQARQWSLRKAGMSGRVANQFVKNKLMDQSI